MGCSLWLAMFRVKHEKIAMNELSEAIFTFQVAFTVLLQYMSIPYVTVGVKDPVNDASAQLNEATGWLKWTSAWLIWASKKTNWA